MEVHLLELKLKQEALEKKMQEQHLESTKSQEEFERNVQKQHEDTMVEQSKINDGISTLLKMMKKQQQTYLHICFYNLRF